jgi:hypothetical protein
MAPEGDMVAAAAEVAELGRAIVALRPDVERGLRA